MKIMMLTRWSPGRGQVLDPGQVVEVPDEIGLDFVQRGIAEVVPEVSAESVGNRATRRI